MNSNPDKNPDLESLEDKELEQVSGGRTEPSERREKREAYKKKTRIDDLPRPCPRCNEPRLPHRVCPNCGYTDEDKFIL